MPNDRYAQVCQGKRTAVDVTAHSLSALLGQIQQSLFADFPVELQIRNVTEEHGAMKARSRSRG